MKKVIIVCLTAMLLIACQKPAPKQYFTEAPEIDLIKSNVGYYLSGDWEGLKSTYIDTAKIYHNSTSAVNVDISIEQLKEDIQMLSNYVMKDSIFYEMVVEDDGDRWVNMWGNWQGTIAGSEKVVEVPIHITSKIKDNKIIEEYGYWDNMPIYMAVKEASKEEAIEAQEE
ncbi:hypothetical protein [Leptobacterium sp. I13]|uniref:hypothetical protein n=1 Tax=Leptobacterium meishanense TaxID=3128904 RepID=UPI0030EBC634